MIPGPVDYRQAPAPGSYKNAVLGVPVHTHVHAALLLLNADDHSNVDYLRIPREKLRVVAPAGAPYSTVGAAVAACAADDVVLVTGGDYVEAATITMPANNIAVIGLNREAVRLNFTAADANHCFDLAGRNGITLREFSITAVGGKTGYGVSGSTGDDLHFERLRIVADGLERGIQIEGGARGVIDKCLIRGGIRYGIISFERTNLCVMHTSIETDYGAGAYALYLSQGADRSLIVDNRFRMNGVNDGNCVYMYNCDDARIFDNFIQIVDPSAPSAILLRAHSDGINVGNIVARNTIIGDGDVGSGIYLYSSAAGNFMDDSIICDNDVFNFVRGVTLADIRVRETLVHGNHLHTCTASVLDGGLNTSNWDNT